VRRNWLVVAIVAGVAAIVVAAVLARVTDDDSGNVEVTAWADSICSDVSEWRSSITSLADVSGETLTPELLREKLDEAQSATEQLVGDLKALGRPDLDAGDEMTQQLDKAADDLQAGFEGLQTQAEQALDADSPTGFLQALAQLAPEFQRVLDDAGSTVDELANANVGEDARAELQQAFAEADSCQQLEEDG
jgi:hypothetical protein